MFVQFRSRKKTTSKYWMMSLISVLKTGDYLKSTHRKQSNQSIQALHSTTVFVEMIARYFACRYRWNFTISDSFVFDIEPERGRPDYIHSQSTSLCSTTQLQKKIIIPLEDENHQKLCKSLHSGLFRKTKETNKTTMKLLFTSSMIKIHATCIQFAFFFFLVTVVFWL